MTYIIIYLKYIFILCPAFLFRRNYHYISIYMYCTHSLYL